MALTQMDDFTFKHSSQIDALYTQYTANQIKSLFDSRGVELRTFINNLVSVLAASTGAANIGNASITDLDGATVQAVLQSIRDKLKSVVDGTSGADFVNATGITGLTGTTVQSLLEALKTYVDAYNTNHKLSTSTDHDNRYYTETEIDLKETSLTNSINNLAGSGRTTETVKNNADSIANHKVSGDHDTRYYTQTQLQSITSGSSGADLIKATPISVNSGNTVQAQLAWLLTQIAVAATGSIPDGSLTESKLAQALIDKINTALSNVGVLTTLLTTNKTNAVNAINEVLTNFNAHKNNNSNPHNVTTTQIGAIAKSLLTQKGQIIYASSAGEPAVLNPGSDGDSIIFYSGVPVTGVPGIKIANGTFSDTTTSFSTAYYTKTIPLGFNAKRGRLFIRGMGSGYGLICLFDTVSNNAICFSIINNSTYAMRNKGLDGGLSLNIFGTWLSLSDAHISNSDLILIFNNSSGGSSQTLNLSYAEWEVEG